MLYSTSVKSNVLKKILALQGISKCTMYDTTQYGTPGLYKAPGIVWVLKP